MIADDLATLAVMVLTHFSQNTPVSAAEWLHVFLLIVYLRVFLRAGSYWHGGGTLEIYIFY